jgi:hypothetical protein
VAPPPRRSAASRLRGALGVLLVIALLAAIVVAIVLLATNAGQNTGPGIELKDHISDQINAIKDFIAAHTK